MILHSEYLMYPGNQYIVMFEGNGPRMARQDMQIRIKSVVRGAKFSEDRQGTGTVESLKSFAKETTDRENPGVAGTWKQFSCAFDKDGKYSVHTAPL